MRIHQDHQIIGEPSVLDHRPPLVTVTAFARSSILSTSLRYTLLSSGEITPPCGTPCFPDGFSNNRRSHRTASSPTRRATFSNTNGSASEALPTETGSNG